MTQGYGFLAIWCAVAPEDKEDYRNWLMKEHIADRTFSPGFLGVRLFEYLDDETSHFILYATEGPEILRGAAYRAILDNPSPWTRRIMPKFGPFDRALGEQVLKVGNGFGTHVAVWRMRLADSAPDLARLSGEFRRLLNLDRVISVRLLAVDHGITGRDSEEKSMRRTVEGEFDYLLCVETAGDETVRMVEKEMNDRLPTLLPALERADSSCCRMFYGEAAHEGPTA